MKKQVEGWVIVPGDGSEYPWAGSFYRVKGEAKRASLSGERVVRAVLVYEAPRGVEKAGKKS